MKPERCQAVSKTGCPCNATPVPGDTRCAWHSPAWAEKRREWSKKGGVGRSNKARTRKALGTDALTMPEVAGLLSLALKGVLSGRLEPGVGNSAASLARALAQVHEVSELEEWLAQLEEAAGIGGRRRA